MQHELVYLLTAYYEDTERELETVEAIFSNEENLNEFIESTNFDKYLVDSKVIDMPECEGEYNH